MGFIFDMLSDWPEIICSRERNPEEELAGAVSERNYPAAYGALRRLKEPLGGAAAAECLCGALDCTPRLFDAILERCEPGEYAAEQGLPAMQGDGVNLRAAGTILTLAAAMDRPKHMEALLQRGWDVNGGSCVSAKALYDKHCSSFVSHPGLTDWRVRNATPLAAAIACGSMDAVRVLLRQTGVKKLEDPSVSAAALAALHGTRRQRAALCLALGLASGADDAEGMARELLVDRAPDAAAAAELCTPGEFDQLLTGTPRSPAQWYAAAEALTEPCGDDHAARDRGKKLRLLLDRVPELASNRALRDRMLNAAVTRLLNYRACEEELLDCWRNACGDERDISGIRSDHRLVGQPPDRVRVLLDELGRDGALCASADNTWLWANAEPRTLSVLTERVRFYRTVTDGVSVLAKRLIWTKNAKLLRVAAANGALRFDQKAELLAYLLACDLPPGLRAAVLTLPEEQTGAELQTREARSWRRWRAGNPDRRAGDYIRELCRKPLSAGECRLRLRSVGSCAEDYMDSGSWAEDVDGLCFDGLAAAACCGRNPALLRVLLEDHLMDPRERQRLGWTDRPEELTGTPLCLAAAAGRTEQVRLLLKLGFDPDEDDVPARSVYNAHDPVWNDRVVTPLGMAVELGHAKTAALLRRYGACVLGCDNPVGRI